MFCPQCGVNNDNAARHCNQCGAALVLPAQPVLSPAQPLAPPPAYRAPAARNLPWEPFRQLAPVEITSSQAQPAAIAPRESLLSRAR